MLSLKLPLAKRAAPVNVMGIMLYDELYVVFQSQTLIHL